MSYKMHINPLTGKDVRYEWIRVLYDDGKIETLSDIFKFLPKTVVATELSMAVDHWNSHMSKLVNLPLSKYFAIGRLCGLSEREIMNLVLCEYERKKYPTEQINRPSAVRGPSVNARRQG